MTSSGAIALAEFLPESASLLHLDLTNNNLDLAGIMALSGGLKANHTMRCLDVNIPPDDEEFARMCRDILNTCVRNTEEAEKTAQTASSGRGSGKGVWGMIEESELAKRFKKVDQKIVRPSFSCALCWELICIRSRLATSLHRRGTVRGNCANGLACRTLRRLQFQMDMLLQNHIRSTQNLSTAAKPCPPLW